MSAKTWLLFENGYEGDHYVGAFQTVRAAKDKAVELWDTFRESFSIQNTEDEDCHISGSIAWRGDTRYLKWSDEEATDTSGQKEKIARFAKEARAKAKAKAALLKKRDSGAKLTIGELAACGFYDMQDAMVANVFNNAFGTVDGAGAALISEAHPYTGGTAQPTGGTE